MAITEKSTPAAYTSAHGDVFYVALSDNIAQPNFKYVFDVYVAAVLVARLKIFPEPNFSLGICNVGEIVRSYLSNNYFIGQSTYWSPAGGDGRLLKEVVIKYGEEYGLTVTLYTNLVTASAVNVYNYYRDILYRNISNPLSTKVNNFLTSGPSTRTVALTENMFMYYWNTSQTGSGFDIVYRKYSSNGTLLGTSTNGVLTAQVLHCLNIGPLAAPGGFIDSAVAYYTVTVDNGNTPCLITLTVDQFPKYSTYNIVFFNQWGGFESVPFRMKSGRKVEGEKKSFGRRDYTYGSSGVIEYIETNNVLRGDSLTYFSKYNHKYRLSTDLLSDAEFAWLQQLVVSPLVYIELFSGSTAYYLPVKIAANSFDIKTQRNDKLNALEIDIEVLQQFNTQFA